MEERTDIHVVECTPEDLRSYLEDDDRLVGGLGTVLESYRIEFRYFTTTEPKHDTDFTPVLNTGAIQRLVEKSPVQWTDSENEEVVILRLEADRSNPLYDDLLEAFCAHNRGTISTSRDPRDVWREFNE